MVLLVVALIIIGFFFPPAWLALIGLGIYLFASHKSRRSDAIESRVKKMVSAGKDYAVFADLHFEAARSYAIAKGAKAPEPNAVSAHILIDGCTYFVVFTRATSGGTIIGVEDATIVRDRVLDRSKMEDFLEEKLEDAFDEYRTNSTSKSVAPKDVFKVGSLSFCGDPSNDEVGADIVNKVTGRVLELSPTELDIYRYLMEEADRLSQRSGIGQWALLSSGITPIEYEGEMNKSDKYPDNRAALEYLNNKVSPDLEKIFEKSKADDFRANIFTNIVLSNAAGINELRKKHAVHYANNCAANGHYSFADKWDEVIKSIP